MKKYILFFLVVMCVGCTIIPTSYTTSTSEKNIVRANTGLQIELLARYEKMDPKILKEFLQQNVKYAILVEEIICGDISDVAKLHQSQEQQP